MRVRSVDRRSRIVFYIGPDGNPARADVRHGDVLDMTIPNGAPVPQGFVAAEEPSPPAPRKTKKESDD